MQNHKEIRDRFEGYLRARRDYACYLATKGVYVGDGDRCHWEPLDYTDLEPEEDNFAPGAVRRGELDDYTWEDCDEF